MKLKNQVSMNYLFKMAIMGLDTAYFAMQKRKNSAVNINYEKHASTSRSRYKLFFNYDKHVQNKITSASINALKFVPEEILNIPFRAFVSPMGKGKFLKLGSELPNSIQTQDIVNYINEDISAPSKMIEEVSQFKSQAVASIAFHSISFVNADAIHQEYDSLDYLFSKENTIQAISNILLQSLPKKYRETAIINEYQFNPHPIKNLTVDAMHRLRRWKDITFSQILNEGMFFPKFLGITDTKYNISDIEYPSHITKLSIFSLNSITTRNNLSQKLPILYNMGFRTIASILMLEKKYRVFFESQYTDSLRKNIEDNL